MAEREREREINDNVMNLDTPTDETIMWFQGYGLVSIHW